MSNNRIHSGKVKKIPSTDVSSQRYEFLSLGEAEPDLGVPGSNGQFLISNVDGTRFWIDANTAGIELGVPSSNGQILSSNTDGTRIWVSTESVVLDSKVASLMPYLINENEKYLVPANTQALFSLSLEINGVLEIDGILVQV
jgi:hypothetical protein